MVEERSANELLNAGIAAAKAGRKAEAQVLLAQSLRVNGQNPLTWLWMSGVVDGRSERKSCLERVLALDPGSEAARQGLARLMEGEPRPAPQVPAAETGDPLEEAIAAVRAGETEVARGLLLQLVDENERNVVAWWWLSKVVDSDEDRGVCLENVLALQPGHAEAQKALNALRQQPDLADENPFNPWAAAPEEEPETKSVSLAAEILGEEYVKRHTPEDFMPGWEIEPDSPQVQFWESLEEDENRCPYCTAQTDPEDKRCPECDNNLWIKVRRSDSRSLAYWILFGLQFINFGLLAVASVVLFSILSLFGGDEGLGLVNLLLLLAASIPAVLSLIFLIGMLLRWPIVYYFLMFQAVINIVTSILVLNTSLVQGVLAIGFSLMHLAFVLSTEDDFLKEKLRVFLRVDRNAKDYTTFFNRGRLYASKKMWALAAIHFRRAAAIMTNKAEGYLALTLVCVQMERPDLARMALAEARNHG